MPRPPAATAEPLRRAHTSRTLPKPFQKPFRRVCVAFRQRTVLRPALPLGGSWLFRPMSAVGALFSSEGRPRRAVLPRALPLRDCALPIAMRPRHASGAEPLRVAARARDEGPTTMLTFFAARASAPTSTSCLFATEKFDNNFIANSFIGRRRGGHFLSLIGTRFGMRRRIVMCASPAPNPSAPRLSLWEPRARLLAS